jgi:hypothetical protein
MNRAEPRTIDAIQMRKKIKSKVLQKVFSSIPTAPLNSIQYDFHRSSANQSDYYLDLLKERLQQG